jgi:alpha-1,3-rhamnosyl/mannosyltransferase
MGTMNDESHFTHHSSVEKRHFAMRVIVNRLAALGQRTGIGHYTLQLIRCLREQAGLDVIAAFPRGWMRRAREMSTRVRPYLDNPASQPASGPGSSQSLLGSMRRGTLDCLRQGVRLVTARHFQAVCARGQYQLYHEPNYIPLPSDLPTVATLCDLSVLLHPEWHPADRVRYFHRYFHRGLAQCVHFLAISEYCRQEIIDALAIAPERVTRTYMGIRPGLRPLPPEEVAASLRQLGLPAQYLLYLGTIEPRKNVLRLMRAYCDLPARLRDNWPLVLVGGWGWNTAEVAEFFHSEARHRGVIHLGYLPEEHLTAVYNGARALVYPSLYEGFGLPPIEMMACGGAVLASTAGALRETVGSKACLLEAEDVAGWRDALARVVEDDDWWQSLRRGVLAVASPFTWDNCAADTLAVYRRLCGVPEPEQVTAGRVPTPLRAAG